MKTIVPLKAKDFADFTSQYEKTKGKADIIEVWLDQIQNQDSFLEDFKGFCDQAPESFLGVCKSVEEGGNFTGTPNEKSHIFHQFLASGGRWVDFDMSRNPINVIAPFPSEKLWLSFHDYQGVPDDLETIMLGMYVLEPAVYKFAVTVQTPKELDQFMQFVQDCPPQVHAIFTTMGEQGKEGREKIGDRSWGGFYALDKDHKTAEGQPTLLD